MDIDGAIAIVSRGTQVCQGILEYYDRWKDFNEDVQRMYQAIACLNTILCSFSNVLSNLDQGRRQCAVEALIACSDNIAKLEKKMKKLQAHDQPKGPHEKLPIQRFYQFKQSTLTKIQAIAIDTQDQLSLTLQVLQLDVGLETEKTIKVVSLQGHTPQAEGHKVLQQTEQTLALAIRQDRQHNSEVFDWLAKTDYAAQQATHIHQRMPGSGLWLMGTPEFRKWTQTTGNFLFLYGAPGAGKTILSSIIIEHLQARLQHTDEGLCYFYGDFNRRHQQQLNKILLCLARQLIEAFVDPPASILKLCNKHRPKGTTPSIEEASQTLHAVVGMYSKLYIVIDALDECADTFNLQQELIAKLLELGNANILITSRPLPKIMSIVAERMELEVRANDNEISRYIDENIDQLPSFVTKSADIQDLVRSSILNAASGVYLLAKLFIDALKGSKSRKHLKSVLRTFEKGTDIYTTAYNKTLDRINSQSEERRKLAIKALTWAIYAHRLIKAQELLHALAIEVDKMEFNESKLLDLDLDQVVTSCFGLITIEENTEFVRPVHQTVREFFAGSGSTWLGDGHEICLRSCLMYLSMKHFRSGICNSISQLKDRFTEHPFYPYASQYWGYHTCDLQEFSVVDAFLKLKENVQAASQALLYAEAIHRYSDTIYVSGVTGLHLAVSFSSTRFVLHTLQHHQIDVTNGEGETAMYCAARRGDPQMVRLLLSNGAKIHNLDNVDLDPFLIAVTTGRTMIVSIFLDNKADANIKDCNGQCALSRAVAYGYQDIAHLLIDKGAQLELRNDSGDTPLHVAAMENRAWMVTKLIQNGAQIEAKNNLGQTPLATAMGWSNFQIISLLINFGAKLDVLDQLDDISQSEASKVKETILGALLLQKRIMADVPDRGSSSKATGSDRDETIRLLLGDGIMSSSVNRMSVLQLAALKGHSAAVRYLLDLEPTIKSTLVIPPLQTDTARQTYTRTKSTVSTGLSTNQPAASNVRLLSHVDNMGRSALHYAAIGPNVEILEYLLSNGMDRYAQDNFGRNLLHYASMSLTTSMLIKVLEFSRSPNMQYNVLWSPLHWACRDGNFDMVKLLVNAGFRSSSVSTTDPSAAWTPLDVAIYYGNTKLISREGDLVGVQAWTTIAESGLIQNHPQQPIVARRANDLRTGKHLQIECVACHTLIIGTGFSCQTCKGWNLCFMCKAEPEIELSLHPGHSWSYIDSNLELGRRRW